MEINDTFEIGQYKSLRLVEVYQGSPNLNRELLKGYLEFCFLDEVIPKSQIFQLCDLQIGVKEMNIIPNIFNEEKLESLGNTVDVGDLSELLNTYFNNYFSKRLLEIIPSFQRFNRENWSTIIGGDPEYISWCMNTIPGFNISQQVKDELAKKTVYRFTGISIIKVAGFKNHYVYEPIIKEDFYSFNSTR
jgi:hypothetical protein